MNRRAFLATLMAGASLDPEKLLWIPGRKKIFIPAAPRYEWMSFGGQRAFLNYNTYGTLIASCSAFLKDTKTGEVQMYLGTPSQLLRVVGDIAYAPPRFPISPVGWSYRPGDGIVDPWKEENLYPGPAARAAASVWDANHRKP